MELLIFTANQTGNKKNCYYPNRVVAKNATELQKAVMMDHVCAEYRNDYRSNANFMQSVVVVMDCDNDHSELPGDWMTPDKLKALLPTVAFAIAPSVSVMHFFRRPTRWISLKRSVCRITAWCHSIMWKTATKPLSPVTFICRCRKKW